MIKEYICKQCGNGFSKKGHLTNHQRRKRHCKPIVHKVIEEKVQETLQELSEKGDIKIKNQNLIINKSYIQTTNMKKTGKDRDIIDQFYTNRDISSKCIDVLVKTIDISNDDLLVEPSAGDGSFSDYFRGHEFPIDSYDIDPKKEYISKMDFLTLNIEKYTSDSRRIHVIGNPPFGRQSSLAKRFIKHCALFGSTISFILPKSFRKVSYQSAFPLHFHLEKEYELDKDAFVIDGKSHNVPCVFQIWVKKDTDRYVEPKPIESGFRFVKRPLLKDIGSNEDGKPIKRENIFTETPDFGILRAGGGNSCGRISLNYKDGIACYPEAWLFIKLDDKYDKDIFYEEYKKIDWRDDSNVGARSISKPIFIKGINQLLESMN